jgi:hypothetical protein
MTKENLFIRIFSMKTIKKIIQNIKILPKHQSLQEMKTVKVIPTFKSMKLKSMIQIINHASTFLSIQNLEFRHRVS